MEAFGVGVGVLGVLDVSIRVIRLINTWIGQRQDVPRVLHSLRIETSTVSAICDSLELLKDADGKLPPGLTCLGEPLRGCKKSLSELADFLEANSSSSILVWIACPTKERTARSHLEELTRHKTNMQLILDQDSRQELKFIRRSTENTAVMASSIVAMMHKMTLEDLLNWIAPLNVTHQASYEAASRARFPGTGNWLLGTNEYRNWKDRGGIFCLDGLPGVGKTVLCSAVIDDLQPLARRDSTKVAVLYYFFEMKDAAKNCLAALFDSLIRQLIAACPSGILDVADLARNLRSLHPSSQQYTQLIRLLMKRFQTVYLVIDGLDSYDCSELGGVARFLQEIAMPRAAEVQQNGYTQAEHSSDVQYLLERYSLEGCELRFFISSSDTTGLSKLLGESVSIQMCKHNDKDIRLYAEGRLDRMGCAANQAMGPELRQRLVDVVVSRSQQNCGLFIQASILLDHITKCSSVSELRRAADHLESGGDDETFKTLLLDVAAENTSDGDLETLQVMLKWLCQANYCLPVPEFVGLVMARETEGNFIDQEAIPFDPETFCAQYLGPLLNIERRVEPHEINLVHVSIEEFLQSGIRNVEDVRLTNFYVSTSEARKFLAKSCIRFLRFENFRIPLSSTDTANLGSRNPFKGCNGGIGLPSDSSQNEWVDRMDTRLKKCRGLEYAAINWLEHTRRAEFTQQEFQDEVKDLLSWFFYKDKDDGLFKSWQEVHAYFCCDDNCDCGKWQQPSYFVERSGLAELFLGGEASEDCERDDNAPAVVPRARTESGPSLCRKRFRCFGCNTVVAAMDVEALEDVERLDPDSESSDIYTSRTVKCPDCRAGRVGVVSKRVFPSLQVMEPRRNAYLQLAKLICYWQTCSV